MVAVPRSECKENLFAFRENCTRRQVLPFHAAESHTLRAGTATYLAGAE